MGKILGINKRTYPSQTNRFLGVDIAVVLVEGDIGDYAAYAGQGDPDWIKAYGDKLCFEEACVHFPNGQLKKAKYRE